MARTSAISELHFVPGVTRDEMKRNSFALKLFAWTEGTIDFRQPHWWRVVQLLAPSKVLCWATGKRDAGAMTPDQFAQYQLAYEGAIQ